MKKFYGFYTILFTMMILIITTSAGAFFAGDGKGVYGGDRKPGIKANDPLPLGHYSVGFYNFSKSHMIFTQPVLIVTIYSH